MSQEPDIYMKLNVPCATKYTNFGLAWYKISFWPHSKNIDLFSRKETSRQVFEAFEKKLPEYIICPESDDLFPYLRDKFPLLFGDYRMKKSENYHVYSRIE